jgi:transposase-like protein
MLAEALQAEVDAYIARFVGERDENGRRLVVRNGSHRSREVLTSAGAVEVTAPRVKDRRVDPDTGERARFASAILPAWCRKTPKITEVLPLLYLHGLSTGDFVPALGQFLGSSAGRSAPVITKLTETGKAEQRTFAARDLSGVDYVYAMAFKLIESAQDRWRALNAPHLVALVRAGAIFVNGKLVERRGGVAA